MRGHDLMPRHRALVPAFLVVLAAATRGLVALRTFVPDRDAAAYLWLAEQAAGGDVGRVFDTAFHPLYPLLVAAMLTVVPGLATVAAGQIVSGACGALAIVPLWATTRRWFGRDAAVAAGVFYALGVWFARYPADCLSEGPFYLAVTGAVWAMARHPARGVLAGVAAGAAFAARPEGASLILIGVPWLWWQGQRRAAGLCAVTFSAIVLLLMLGWARYGVGFVLTPKLAFNLDVGINAAGGSAVAHYLGHLVQVPGDLLEAIGYAAVPMAMFGLWRARHTAPAAAVLVGGLVLLQVAAIPMLRSHFRFVSGYGVLLLPFAGLTWRVLRPRWQSWHVSVRVAVVLLAFAGDIVRLPQARRVDRLVLIELGSWLAPRLTPDARLVTLMMPRLEYFAGQRPAPNIPLSRDVFLDACKPAAVRYAVIIEGRAGVTPGDLQSMGFGPVRLPAELERQARARRLVVMQRTPR